MISTRSRVVLAAVIALIAIGLGLLVMSRRQAEPGSPQKTPEAARQGGTESGDATVPNAVLAAAGKGATEQPAAGGAGADLSGYVDLPSTEDFVSTSEHVTEESARAVKEAILNGLRAPSLEEACEHYREYIRRFPLTVDAIVMRNRLGGTLTRIGHIAEARRVLKDAIALAGNDRFANIIKINLAHLETTEKNYDLAERMLREIASKPLPESFGDPYAVVPQAFVAPRFLAELHKARGELAEAHRVLQDSADLAVKLIAEHPDATWLPSYLGGAYLRRIALLYETEPQEIGKAEKLLEELDARLPAGYRGTERQDAQQSLRFWRARLREEERQRKD